MPFGYGHNIYRQADGGASPATEASPKGDQIDSVMWTSRDDSWLDLLTRSGKALRVDDGGWKCTATARDLMHCSYFFDAYDGCDHFSRRALAACRPDEWLLIDVWDDWF